MITVFGLVVVAFFLAMGRKARRSSEPQLRRPLPRAVLRTKP